MPRIEVNVKVIMSGGMEGTDERERVRSWSYQWNDNDAQIHSLALGWWRWLQREIQKDVGQMDMNAHQDAPTVVL